MFLNQKQLIGLEVETESGQRLGQVKDFEFNSETQQLEKYIVSSPKLVEKLLVHDLIIDSSRVIEIREKVMIVDDNLIEQKKFIREPVAT
ncbi:MAG: PRC-barrel domain-containing protein [Patescibacteria group bacterium]